jgi:hypothetical protein
MKTAGFFVLLAAASLGFAAWTNGNLLQGDWFWWGAILLYVALFAGLARGWMWVGWLALVAMLVGIAAAVAMVADLGATDKWVVLTQVTAHGVAAAALFLAIWAGRPAAQD